MRKTYYLCFSINKITLSQEANDSLDLFALFNLALFKGTRVIGTTETFICATNQKREVTLQKMFIHFRLRNYSSNVKEVCQLRFNALPEYDKSIELGSYQFVLNNYIKVFQDFHSNCIPLRMEIGEHYMIEYNVFIENSDEALKKIVFEHYTAEKDDEAKSEFEEKMSDLDSLFDYDLTSSQNISHFHKKMSPENSKNKSREKKGPFERKPSSPVKSKMFSTRSSSNAPEKDELFDIFKGLTDLTSNKRSSPSPNRFEESPPKFNFIKIKKTQTLMLTPSQDPKQEFRKRNNSRSSEKDEEELMEKESTSIALEALVNLVKQQSKITVSSVQLNKQSIEANNCKKSKKEQLSLKSSLKFIKNNFQIIVVIIIALGVLSEVMTIFQQEHYKIKIQKPSKARSSRR